MAFLSSSTLFISALILFGTSNRVSAFAFAFPLDERDEVGSERVGWVWPSMGRSTLGLLWTCGTSLFLCSWQSLLIHLPAPSDSGWAILRRKFLLTVLAIMAPELLFAIALDQWLSARQSVKDFKTYLEEQKGTFHMIHRTSSVDIWAQRSGPVNKLHLEPFGHRRSSSSQSTQVDHQEVNRHEGASEHRRSGSSQLTHVDHQNTNGDEESSGHRRSGSSQSTHDNHQDTDSTEEPEWTQTHAFFADAGGFHLKDRLNNTTPLNSKQLLELIRKKYIGMPCFTERQIQDKNKTDVTFRVYWFIHLGWFCLTTITRLVQHLPITTLELTTLAFASCSALSAILRFHKPGDIRVPEYIDTSYSLQEIVARERPGHAYNDFRYSPFDFMSHEEWHWSRLWANWSSTARTILYLPDDFFGPIEGRIENTYTWPLAGPWYWLLIAVCSGYASVFFTAWHHDFALPIQSMLWRASTLAVLLSMLAYELVEKFGLIWWPGLCHRFPSLGIVVDRWVAALCLEHVEHRAIVWCRERGGRLAAWLRNNSPQKDPNLDLPLKVVLPTYLLGICYLFGRFTIFVVDLWELASLPAGAYEPIHWPSWANMTSSA